MEPLTRRLLSLPGGVHFRKLTLTWLRKEDPLLATALVKRCSHTFESLVTSMVCPFHTHLRPNNLILFPAKSSVDLSNVRELKDMVFRCCTQSVQWVIAALQTITPNHTNLQQITLHTGYTAFATTLPTLGVQLERRSVGSGRSLTAQLYESRSIRPKVLDHSGHAEGMSSYTNVLLPVTKGRVTGLIEQRV